MFISWTCRSVMNLSTVAMPVVAGVVFTALMICTWFQVRYWRDPIALYEHTLEETGGSFLIHNDVPYIINNFLLDNFRDPG
jgi:hypothetical protein